MAIKRGWGASGRLAQPSEIIWSHSSFVREEKTGNVMFCRISQSPLGTSIYHVFV